MKCVRRLGSAFGLFFAGALSLSQGLSATVVYIDDLQTMTRQSDVVIHAVVADQTVKEDGDGRILTISTLEILYGLKGAKTGELITLYQVGGELGGRVLKVLGAQNYTFGEEVVLFGVRLGDMIVSYSVGLGKFKVLRDDNQIRVVEDLNDLVEAKPTSTGELTFDEPHPRKYPSLDGFKAAIRESIAVPNGPQPLRTKVKDRGAK